MIAEETLKRRTTVDYDMRDRDSIDDSFEEEEKKEKPVVEGKRHSKLEKLNSFNDLKPIDTRVDRSPTERNSKLMQLGDSNS